MALLDRSQYDVGDVVVLSCSFDVGGVATDPTAVTLAVELPSGDLEVYTYDDDQIEKDAVGRYRAHVPATESGKWRYRWAGTGDAAGAEEDTFWVRPQMVGGA